MTPDWSPKTMAAHEKIMRAVAIEIASGKGVYVLKGGTALMFARGLDRFSTDLDYDSPKKLSLEATIRAGFRKTGARIADLRILRDSGLAQKMIVSYDLPGAARIGLKIEARIKSVPPDDIERTPDGFLVYTPQKQLAQKLHAANARGNRAPRDLYDIAFLVWKFPRAVAANADSGPTLICFPLSRPILIRWPTFIVPVGAMIPSFPKNQSTRVF
jgi:predicted nucleotidyltransferase component of viral defense system